MKNSIKDIQRNAKSVASLAIVTGAYESIASMHIRFIRDKVLASQDYFNTLWTIYSRLRVDSFFRFGTKKQNIKQKQNLIIIITSGGGLSGNIDADLIRYVLDDNPSKGSEFLVIGKHGVRLLATRGVQIQHYFDMPSRDDSVNVNPILNIIENYEHNRVYYSRYVSLSEQIPTKIDLISKVKASGKDAKNKDELINDKNFIFEPSTYAVCAHLERSMVGIALGQCILESKLAIFASRFRSMTAAESSAKKTLKQMHQSERTLKRMLADGKNRGQYVMNTNLVYNQFI